MHKITGAAMKLFPSEYNFCKRLYADTMSIVHWQSQGLPRGILSAVSMNLKCNLWNIAICSQVPLNKFLNFFNPVVNRFHRWRLPTIFTHETIMNDIKILEFRVPQYAVSLLLRRKNHREYKTSWPYFRDGWGRTNELFPPTYDHCNE